MVVAVAQIAVLTKGPCPFKIFPRHIQHIHTLDMIIKIIAASMLCIPFIVNAQGTTNPSSYDAYDLERPAGDQVFIVDNLLDCHRSPNYSAADIWFKPNAPIEVLKVGCVTLDKSNPTEGVSINWNGGASEHFAPNSFTHREGLGGYNTKTLVRNTVIDSLKKH
ncbi:hypothetical protein SB783_02560 [Paraburkholderia sp. SIMBA_009]|nr:hypothetical protein [Paraburkholderia tropica]